MQIKRNITLAAVALVVTGASLGGVALASSDGTKADASVSQSVEKSATAANEAPEINEAPDANEAPETDSGSEAEGAESDGPGGHEDPPGNVNHEFEGEE